MDHSLSDFEPLIGQTFDVPHHESGEVYSQLTLREATPVGRPHADRAEPFSLIFDGPKASALDQGTYLLRNETLGENYIFVVPIGESGDLRQYQAIFN